MHRNSTAETVNNARHLETVAERLVNLGWQVVVDCDHPGLADYLEIHLKSGKTVLIDPQGDVLLSGDRARDADTPWIVSGHGSQWSTAVGGLWAVRQLGR